MDTINKFTFVSSSPYQKLTVLTSDFVRYATIKLIVCLRDKDEIVDANRTCAEVFWDKFVSKSAAPV
jgi:hypothetical protein